MKRKDGRRPRHLRRIGFLLGVGLGLLTISGPATAAPPSPGGIGGSFTNPCNGNFVVFDVPGIQVIQFTPTGGIILAFAGTGSGFDAVTGATYRVVFNTTTTFEHLGGASFTGHATIVFIRAAETFVVHSVAQLNLRPDEPVSINFTNVTCAGSGPTSF